MKKVLFGLVLLGIICMSACQSNNRTLPVEADDTPLSPTMEQVVELAEEKKDLSDFYEKIKESQSLMDDIADDIYSNWYDAIYKDSYRGDINLAIYAAQREHIEDLEKIEEIDSEISELLQKVKDGDNGTLVKEVMTAYSDYYEFVVNVSGSFKSYSENKETLKKNLASLLRSLSYEL